LKALKLSIFIKLLLGVPQIRAQLEKEIGKFFADLDSVFQKKK
jgi:hypothetical protein